MKYLRAFLIFYIIVTIYTVFTLTVNKGIFEHTNRSYYTYLLDAFFHGRLNVESPETFDLSLFKNKWYLYWGPAPALFILPFYLIWGLATSDVLYTLVAGILNVFLFYFVVNEFQKYFKIHLPHFMSLFVVLHFAFASPNFYLSLVGKVWPTEQVISILYLLLFFLFYFKFLHNLNNLLFLGLSVLFFNLAWLSRYTLISHAAFFLYPLLLLIRSKKISLFKHSLFLIGIVTGGFIFLTLMYNYARFGNVLDTGVQYQNANVRFVQLLHQDKVFSPDNFLPNFWYYFLKPFSVSSQKPFLKIDIEGNSVFLTYPSLFFLFFYFLRMGNISHSKKVFFSLLAFLIAGIHVVGLLFFFGTGWVQFGNRYFFDVIPILFLLTLFVSRNIPLPIHVFILFYGIIVNFLGALIFHSLLR